jgi:hypothetical protein
MREPRDGEDIGKLRRDTRIGGRGVFVVDLGLLRRLHAEEGGVWRPLAVHEWHEPEIGELLLAAIGDRCFRGALHRDVARVGAEVMYRESFD